MGYSTVALHPHPTSPSQQAGKASYPSPSREKVEAVASFATQALSPSREKVSGEAQFGAEAFQHAVYIRQDIMVPEADHAVAMRFDKRGARGVTVAGRMLSAIQFDDQSRPPAGEVGDMRADRKLADKFEAVELPRAQSCPQRLFRFGRVAAQHARGAGQAFLHHRLTPSPNLLPQGRGLWSVSVNA